MRRGREVSGTYGIGKVQIVYKPRKVRPWLPYIIGFFVYTTFIGTYFTSFLWSKPLIRANYIVPAWKGLIYSFDLPRSIANAFIRQMEGSGPSDHFHITAENYTHLIYRQGYMHARDNLYEMDIYRRISTGTMSVVFGNKTLYLDTFSKTLKFHASAVDSLSSSSSMDTIDLLAAYSQGVNDALEREHRFLYPLDFYYSFGPFRSVNISRWEASHSLAILNFLKYERSHGWEDELVVELLRRSVGDSAVKDMLKTLKEETSELVGGALLLDTIGGNSFSLREGKSGTFASKTSFLVSDHHSQMKNQAFYNAMRLQVVNNSHDSMDVQGVTFPGIPFVLSGTTGKVAWSFATPRVHSIDAKDDGQKMTMLNKHDGFVGDELTVIDDSEASTALMEQTHATAFSRIECILLPELIANAGDSSPTQHAQHCFTVAESPKLGIEVTGLLTNEILSAARQHSIRHVFLRSPVSSAVDDLEVIHQLNRAQSRAHLEDAVTSTTTWPWHTLYAASNEDDNSIGVYPASALRNSPTFKRNQAAEEVKMIIAGHSAGINQRIFESLSKDGSPSAESFQSILEDSFSPSGLLLAQQLAVLLPTVWEPIYSAPSGELSSEQIRLQGEYRSIVQLLDGFDGYYTATAAAPVIIESFRVHCLSQLLQPLGVLGYALLGSRNVTALVRETEIDLRSQLPVILAPYAAEAERKLSIPGYSSSVELSSHWVDKSGGINALVRRAWDAAVEWIRRSCRQENVALCQWQYVHHAMVSHAVSPVNSLPSQIFCF